MSDEIYSRPRRTLRYVVIAAVIAAVITGYALLAGGDGDGATDESGPNSGQTITIVGFAVPEAANKAIAAAFVQIPAGKGVSFKTSYGASGDQSRAVASGLAADYVHFSVATDVDRLVDAGLVDAAYDAGANKGVVSTSVVVLGVREGNPKNIQGWDDLVKPGVGVMTANPASSGAARWNALAAWAHITANGGSDADAVSFVNALFANVVSLTNSGRDATQSFLDGNGDVLLAYENEAILAAQNGEGFEYIIPDTTIKIENAGALLKEHTPAAEPWLEFVLSDEGQKQFALKGFRPIRDEVDFGGTVPGAPDPDNPFPRVHHLVTIESLGGWPALTGRFFGDGKDGAPLGIVTEAIQQSGKASQ